jgi:hypothetical protein
MGRRAARGEGTDVERASPSGQLVQASVSPLRDLSEVDTRPLGPGGPQSHPPALPTGPADTDLADIAALPTRRLTWPGERPPGAVDDPSPPQRDPLALVSHRVVHRRLPGPEAYEREAEQVRARATRLEQHLWDLSEQARLAQRRAEQLRTVARPTTAQAQEMAQVGQNIVRLLGEIAVARQTYVALLSEASSYLTAAQVVRQGERR